MPRYYFHIKTSDGFVKDPEGAEFPSLERASDEAKKAAREMLSEMILSDEVIDGQRFVITLEDGRVLREVPFRSVFRLE